LGCFYVVVNQSIPSLGFRKRRKMKKSLFLIFILGVLLSSCKEAIPVISRYEEDSNYLGGYVCSEKSNSFKIYVGWRKDNIFSRFLNLINPLRASGDCLLVTANSSYHWVEKRGVYMLVERK